MNLASLLVERAELHPERLALVDSCGAVSYGEFARRVSAGAAELQEMGLKRGQVILVFQPVSIELYEILLAAFHAGLRVMLADPSAGREFLSHCCQRLMPDAFFGSWKAQCLKLTVAEMRGVRLSICSRGWFPGAKPWQTDCVGGPPVAVSDAEAALVTFTSGSTGKPKAAVRSHGFLLAQHRALSKALDFVEGEVDLITLPVFVLANLASGLTSVLAATDLAKPGSPDVAAVRAQCEKFHVTRCAASPAFFEGFLASMAGVPEFEKVFTGGAPVFPDLLRRLRDALPEASVHSVYGSTEAEPIAHFPADEETGPLTRQGGGLCAGLPVEEIDLRIIRDQWGAPLGPLTEEEFAALAVEAGLAGEIVVSGDHVLRGYLGGIGDEEAKIHVGGRVWHRTGDAGWMDSQGRVWLLGRCAEKMPGETRCYPFAIECAMREVFPDIRMAALDWNGQRTLVVGKKCLDTESNSIRSNAAELGIGKVIFLTAIPLDRRHHAKIDYPALRGLLKQ
ncbi:MAG: AMP-binding protein [Luteolibacter sp.]